MKQSLGAYQSQWQKISKNLSFLERLSLVYKLNIFYRCESEKDLVKQKNKLSKLWNSDRCKSPPCLINLSKKKLTVCEENALRLGLKHHVLPKEVKGDSLKVELEDLVDGILKEKEAIKKVETGQWSEIPLQ